MPSRKSARFTAWRGHRSSIVSSSSTGKAPIPQDRIVLARRGTDSPGNTVNLATTQTPASKKGDETPRDKSKPGTNAASAKAGAKQAQGNKMITEKVSAESVVSRKTYQPKNSIVRMVSWWLSGSSKEIHLPFEDWYETCRIMESQRRKSLNSSPTN